MKRISELTREELEALALTDPLTGIGNRRAFDEHEADGEPMIFYGYLDLEGLKYINDTLGHAAGDAMLRAAARLLMARFPRSYRLGGDEFVVSSIFSSITQSLDDVVADLPLLSYGVGINLAEAEADLRARRQVAETNGHRARRGERPRNLARVVEQEVG